MRCDEGEGAMRRREFLAGGLAAAGSTAWAGPAGVQVRAFLPDGWYGRRFSHALRLDGLGSGSGPAPEVAEGGDV